MDRIYVAGFDVFYPDWLEKRYLEYRALCAGYGFEMQAQKAAPDAGKTLGEQIFFKNIHCIEISDYVVANVNCFRGGVSFLFFTAGSRAGWSLRNSSCYCITDAGAVPHPP